MIKTMKVTHLILFTAIALTLSPTALKAQSDDTPLEISADGTLEWNRADSKLIARGNAKAEQGKSSIQANTLTAHYKKGKNDRVEVSEIVADGGVIIRAQDSAAYGSTANYMFDKSIAIMTGSNLRMISSDQVVTAKNRFEYHVDKGKLLAIGNAVASRPNRKGGKDRLQADSIAAIFKENSQGKRVLKSLEARDNVVISTPTEKITGNYGIFNANTNKAEIKGDVTITRGPNILKGTRAEVDLNTNISRIFGDKDKPGGRVKAVFYPGSEE